MGINREINDAVGWGVDAKDSKVLFCNRCRMVLYKTNCGARIIQAKRIFTKKHQCK